MTPDISLSSQVSGIPTKVFYEHRKLNTTLFIQSKLTTQSFNGWVHNCILHAIDPKSAFFNFSIWSPSYFIPVIKSQALFDYLWSIYYHPAICCHQRGRGLYNMTVWRQIFAFFENRWGFIRQIVHQYTNLCKTVQKVHIIFLFQEDSPLRRGTSPAELLSSFILFEASSCNKYFCFSLLRPQCFGWKDFLTTRSYLQTWPWFKCKATVCSQRITLAPKEVSMDAATEPVKSRTAEFLLLKKEQRIAWKALSVCKRYFIPLLWFQFEFDETTISAGGAHLIHWSDFG